MQCRWSFTLALTLLLGVFSSGCSGTNGGGALDTVTPSRISALLSIPNQNSAARVPGRYLMDGAPRGVKKRLYISGFGYNGFKIYNSNGALLGTVSGGIQNSAGIGTDPSGHIYVANRIANGTISVFKPGAQQPFESLVQPSGSKYINSFPSGVCAARDGTIYGVFAGQSTYVAVYKNGSTSPSSLLVGPTFTAQMIACALDPAGNLFVTYYRFYGSNQQYASVLEFQAASGSGTDLGFLWGNVGGIAADSNGNVVVAASPPKFGLDQAVLVIKPGTQKPLRVLLEVDTGAAYFGVAFDASRRFLYVVNAGEYKYIKLDYAAGKVLWAKQTGWTYSQEPYYIAVSPLAD
jgi:hypothetical protein